MAVNVNPVVTVLTPPLVHYTLRNEECAKENGYKKEYIFLDKYGIIIVIRLMLIVNKPSIQKIYNLNNVILLICDCGRGLRE